MIKALKFDIHHRLDGALARTGTITTPHGTIQTPAFIPVGTKAALKSLTTEQLDGVGAQALLVNAYHLYLRPGHDIIDQAGGVHRFMNWNKPMFSDSGGFQVMSLGVGFKKVIDMTGETDEKQLVKKNKLAWISNDGVRFKSHVDGSMHMFTPELSMQIQHGIGADITFAFDELTTLHHDYYYQIESLDQRTHPWAQRSLAEHQRLNTERSDRPPQALFGVIQGADYEDLRRKSAKFLGSMDFDGYGLGGALRKETIGDIVRWMNEELPENKPRHMLGISEPDDIFACIENGADTFDCVSPARVARNGALYTNRGRVNITRAQYKNDFTPFDADCDCYTCQNYTSAYVHHLFNAGEMLSKTLATIHNERFIVRLVDDIRTAIADGTFFAFKEKFLNDYYSNKQKTP
jgi:queuine tRNA-ribosyltransferase